jgi:hypothetical protein
VDGMVGVCGVMGVFKALEVLINDSGGEPGVFAEGRENTLGDAMGNCDGRLGVVVPAKVVGARSVGRRQRGPDILERGEGCWCVMVRRRWAVGYRAPWGETRLRAVAVRGWWRICYAAGLPGVGCCGGRGALAGVRGGTCILSVCCLIYWNVGKQGLTQGGAWRREPRATFAVWKRMGRVRCWTDEGGYSTLMKMRASGWS